MICTRAPSNLSVLPAFREWKKASQARIHAVLFFAHRRMVYECGGMGDAGAVHSCPGRRSGGICGADPHCLRMKETRL